MKKIKSILIIVLIFPILGFSQIIEDLDFISPFHDGFAAIKKDNQWGFINSEGAIVVDYRNDLVTTKMKDYNYPVFSEGRCLIKQVRDGISYFGFINATGKTSIEPQFLNANNFKDNKAIALKLVKETVSRNTALDKNIVYYKYFEVTIDTNGTVIDYLTQKGQNIVLDKDYLRKPPKINSKQISKNVFIIKNKHNKWRIFTTKD
ncbi:hypothetical protein FBALC1_06723 [Flavobacteriales bacterium ALC-1]|nr:hypothetical protein FBALC1_06723 [Flavobacteriales bacterium ALC-1]